MSTLDTFTVQQVSLNLMESLNPERIREKVCRCCAFPLWMGNTLLLNVWDDEAEESIIHPADEYAQHVPVMVGIMEESGRFECAACGQGSTGAPFVFERDRPTPSH
ncbi:hypothetical protein M3C97_011510 [Micrococcus luteus]|nr:hypothetical protein [Micrococcus luteus]